MVSSICRGEWLFGSVPRCPTHGVQNTCPQSIEDGRRISSVEEALSRYVSKQMSQDEEEERESIEGTRCDDRETVGACVEGSDQARRESTP